MLQKQKRYTGLIESVTGNLTWNPVRMLEYYSKVEILENIEPGDLEKLTAHNFSELTPTVFIEIQMCINK